jgi:hypothetical protein
MYGALNISFILSSTTFNKTLYISLLLVYLNHASLLIYVNNYIFCVRFLVSFFFFPFYTYFSVLS